MTITAKYRSQCPRCRGRIQPGEPVEWTRGAPAYHVACATSERAAFASLDRTRHPAPVAPPFVSVADLNADEDWTDEDEREFKAGLAEDAIAAGVGRKAIPSKGGFWW